MIHVLKCCVNEQVSVLAMIMDWCCALHFYLLLCTLTSQRSENRHLCVWVCNPECLRSALFSSAVKRPKSTFCDTVSPLRVRSVSTGHSGSVEVKPEISMDLPTYNQVAYE